MWQPMLPSLTLAQAGGEGVSGASGAASSSAASGGTAIGPNGNPTGTGAPQSPPGGGFMLLLLAVMVGMILISMLGGRKEKKKKAQMMAAMAKGDRVQTIGGILGHVVEVRENDVLLKVDENANTKIRFAKSAVQTVLESKAGKAAEIDDAKETEETKDDA